MRNTKIYQRHKGGATAIELVLYMAIITMFLLVMTQLFVSIFDVQLESEATSPIEQDARFILARMTYDAGRATSVADPAIAGIPQSSLTLTVDGAPVIYASDAGLLTLTTPAGTAALNSYGTTVTAMSFERIGEDAPTVRITMTLKATTLRTQGEEERSFTTAIGMRLPL
jgi:hypothetical protein